ncbi:MAG: hypothetical protein FWB96_10355 [Defluviitaleaceae bacterium]|nr:hypothetical protein [Defluviitaleaceae bacterium]MCL2264156.1 hypothetical protein [Defluviitaleaceae bacterium]
MIVLWIFLWILIVAAALVLLVLLLSAVPIKYSATAKVDNGTDVSVRVSWLFRLVRFVYENRGGVEKMDFRILFFKINLDEEKPPQPSEKKAAPQNSSPDKKTHEIPPEKKENVYETISNSFHVLTESKVKQIIKPVKVAIKKILKLLLPKYIDISGVMGLPCPFETGLLVGAYETVAGMFRLRDKVRFAGDFNTDVLVFRVNADIRGRFSVFQIAIPIIGLVLHKPVRLVIRDMLRKER